MKEVYLDYNSTTPLSTEARIAMEPFLTGTYGNASSLHRAGQSARHAVETARERLAAAIGAVPGDITFTSGGTESNNLAIKGLARERLGHGKRHLVIGATEHLSVLDAARDLQRQEKFDLTEVPARADGRIDPADFSKALREDTALVSVMQVNNETGAIQPVAEIARLARERGVPVHCDMVQSLGKIPVNIAAAGCDLATFTAHKIYGPKGAGALWARRGLKLRALVHGGSQEKNTRPGTENVAAIAGFGRAAELAAASVGSESAALAPLRELLWEELARRAGGVRRNGEAKHCVAQTLNVSFEDVDGTALAMNLDLAGIYVSTGSACTAGTAQPSHVLLAMGLDEKLARGAVRFSLGRFTEEADIRRVAETAAAIVGRLRKTAKTC